MILWFWDGYYDPWLDAAVSSTTSQISWWNEVYWSSAEYDRLCEQQAGSSTRRSAPHSSGRCSRRCTPDNPQNVLHVLRLPAGREHREVEGWTPYFGEGGPVFYNGMIQSYLNVGPKAAAEGEASYGGGSTGTVAAIVVAVAVVAGAVLWWALRTRRKDRAEEV